jgi:hypothetical protein
MRAGVDVLTTPAAIAQWIDAAVGAGMDPL